ncbi:MAG: (deoxy)nucleoside triphosphate pyrophosphohydrolase [Clostridiales bacterium]
MKLLEVVAAIIIVDNKILCTKRDKSKFEYVSFKYEFPGGKIEVGEDEETALKREIMEELKMNIYDLKKFYTVNHTYPDFKLKMYSYLCNTNSEKIILREHIKFKWLKVKELDMLDWAEADIPIVKKLQGE